MHGTINIRYDNIRFFVSFIFHCSLPSFLTLPFLTMVYYNTTEGFDVSTQKSAMLYFFRVSLYDKLHPLTTGFSFSTQPLCPVLQPVLCKELIPQSNSQIYRYYKILHGFCSPCIHNRTKSDLLLPDDTYSGSFLKVGKQKATIIHPCGHLKFYIIFLFSFFRHPNISLLPLGLSLKHFPTSLSSPFHFLLY